MNIDALKGKILSDILIDEDKENVTFITIDGEKYKMYHEQDCCEDVRIESIDGDMEDLLGSVIMHAEEVTQEGHAGGDDTATWTFYKISTNKGGVTIRWYGVSNGYYSEEVSFSKITS